MMKSNVLRNQEYYEVEEIIDKKLTGNGMMYLIRWAGYPERKDYTWEPIQHLAQVERLVKEFNLKYDKRTPGPKAEQLKVSSKLASKLKKHNEEAEEVEEVEEEEPKPTMKRLRAKPAPRPVKKDVEAASGSESEEVEQPKPRRLESRASNASKNAEQVVDKFWEKEGLQLGHIHNHHNVGDKLLFNVDLEKDGMLCGHVYLSYETLVKVCRDKLIDYMEKEVKFRLIQERELQSDYAKEFQEYWRVHTQKK